MWDLIYTLLIGAASSIIITFLTLRLMTEKVIIPALDKKFGSIDKLTKQTLTSLGEKSIEVRQNKAIEKAVAGDIFNNMPEIKAVIQLLSPETLELLEKNPEMTLQLLTKYKPLLDQFFGQSTKQQQQTYDI